MDYSSQKLRRMKPFLADMLTLKKSNEDIPRVKSKEGQHMKHIILGSEFVVICQMGIFTEISLEVGHFSPKVDDPYMEHIHETYIAITYSFSLN